MESLIQNFQSAYTPGREIALDESMIGFKGRLGFLQYMPKKPTKWGLTGYGCNWKLYTGIKTKKLAHLFLCRFPINSKIPILKKMYTST